MNFPLTKKLSFSLGGSLGKVSGEGLENNKLFRIGGDKNSEISMLLQDSLLWVDS